VSVTEKIGHLTLSTEQRLNPDWKPTGAFTAPHYLTFL